MNQNFDLISIFVVRNMTKVKSNKTEQLHHYVSFNSSVWWSLLWAEWAAATSHINLITALLKKQTKRLLLCLKPYSSWVRKSKFNHMKQSRVLGMLLKISTSHSESAEYLTRHFTVLLTTAQVWQRKLAHGSLISVISWHIFGRQMERMISGNYATFLWIKQVMNYQIAQNKNIYCSLFLMQQNMPPIVFNAFQLSFLWRLITLTLFLGLSCKIGLKWDRNSFLLYKCVASSL